MVKQDTLDTRIETYFEEFGWAFEKVEAGVFRTGFRGEHGNYTMVVQINPHWMLVGINPFQPQPSVGWGRTAVRLLASANHTMNLTKAGIDEDGDVFLNVELPTDGLSFAQFSDAIGALSHFADDLTVPLLQAARVDAMNRAHIET